MKKIAKLIPAAGLALAVLSTTPAGAGDRIVARVGSEPVTYREVLEVQERGGQDISYKDALELLVGRKAIISWAREQGLETDEAELNAAIEDIAARNKLTLEQFGAALKQQGQSMASFRNSLSDQILFNKALGRALSERMHVGEADIRSAYADLYPPETSVTARHILFSVETGSDQAAVDAAKGEALAVLDDLKAGKLFEEMAGKHSDDISSAANGGMLGTFRRGELLTELDEALSELSPGEVGGPVRTRLGFHIIRLDSRDTSPPPPLEEVREKIRQSLLASREETARKEWLGELREATYIEIFEQ